jgi:hypothetical protein
LRERDRYIYIEIIKEVTYCLICYHMSYTIGNQVYRHNFIQVYCIYVCIFNLQGKTPLHVAVSNKDTRIVELLIEKGADPNNRDDDVSTKYIWS